MEKPIVHGAITPWPGRCRNSITIRPVFPWMENTPVLPAINATYKSQKMELISFNINSTIYDAKPVIYNSLGYADMHSISTIPTWR
jgi:hypothetical protein